MWSSSATSTSLSSKPSKAAVRAWSGATGVTATGSTLVALNDVGVEACFLPPGASGYFIVSSSPASIPGLPGPTVCVGGPNIGRFLNHVGQGPVISHPVDLTAIPGRTPSLVQPGDTWRRGANHSSSRPPERIRWNVTSESIRL
jgi:hypothetical protein